MYHWLRTAALQEVWCCNLGPESKVSDLTGPWMGWMPLFCKKYTVSIYPLNSYVYSHRLVQNSKLIREVSLCCVGSYHTSQHAENKWLCKAQSQMGHLFHLLHHKVQITSWKRDWKDYKSQMPWRIWEKQYLLAMTGPLHSQTLHSCGFLHKTGTELRKSTFYNDGGFWYTPNLTEELWTGHSFWTGIVSLI